MQCSPEARDRARRALHELAGTAVVASSLVEPECGPRDTWVLELVARADGLPPAICRTLARHDLSLLDVQTMDGGEHTRAVAVA